MEYAGVAIIPIIVGLIEVLKKFDIDEKYIPISALVLGVLAGVLLGDASIKEGIVQGIYMGLASVGLFSGVKNTIEEFKR